MAISQSLVVTIEFTGAAPLMGDVQMGGMISTRNIHMVEAYIGSKREFTLYEGDTPGYTFSDEETAQLEQLLRQIEMKAPWQAQAGFDGTSYELTLQGAMSSATFRWWLEVPAEWERVGAVFDYVLEVADGYHTGKSG